MNYSPTLSISDIGSSASRVRGSHPAMSVYDPYSTYQRQPYPMYGVPTAQSYYYAPSASYAPSAAYTSYTTGDRYSSRGLSGGMGQDRVYFSLNGKLIRSHKVRSFRRAQRHVLDLYPDMLHGIASSRIQFFVMRPGYSRGRYVGLKSYISRGAWLAEIDSLSENDTIGIDVRPSVSFIESIRSFFNRSAVL
ncbi:hypothetical protein BJV74DRAFT_188872 [Russula compacta]|nr:hypothetical protein BJV74DRAFT_188872 [Russula compacta]